MCGIVGFLDFNKFTSREVLLAMNKSLKHRGPDGEGVIVSQEENYVFGLGHQRLSIIDLSTAGHQPMAFENFTITYNGESLVSISLLACLPLSFMIRKRKRSLV